MLREYARAHGPDELAVRRVWQRLRRTLVRLAADEADADEIDLDPPRLAN